MKPTLTLTASLAHRATAQDIDLTPLAMREQAFNDMLASARKFDGSYEAAKARFDMAGVR